jgi:Na+/H+-dicarboxylate symporter
MNNLLKNKRVIQIVLLAALLGLAATPIGREYASQLQPLIKQVTGMNVAEAPAEATEATETAK